MIKGLVQLSEEDLTLVYQASNYWFKYAPLNAQNPKAPLLFIIKSFLTSFVIPIAVLVLDHDCVVVCGIVNLAVQTLLALSRAG